jgi:hypothetical protein
VIRLFIAAALGALSLVVGGCESMLRPSAASRIDSAARGDAHFADKRREIEQAVFLTLSSNSPTAPQFTSHGNQGNLQVAGDDVISGLAAGITADGYLLTAAHVTKKYCWAIGWMAGRLSIEPAEVVARKYFGVEASEFAVLHVRAGIDCHFQIAAESGADETVFSVAFNREQENGVVILEGRVLKRLKVAGTEDVQVVSTDCPTWHGDSGGPVLSDRGELLGINVGYFMPWYSLRVLRTACFPGRSLITTIVENDRIRRNEPKQATEQSSPSRGGSS